MQEDLDLDPVPLDRLRILGNAKLRSILELFQQFAPDRIKAAHECHQKGDLRGVAQAVHSIKSSAGNLGVRKIQNIANTIEQLITTVGPESSERIGPLLHDLQRAWVQAEPLLQVAIEKCSA